MQDDERFSSLIRNLRVGVIVQAADSQILVSNPAARELLGLTEDQLLGRSSYDPAWQVTREDGTPFRAEERPVAMVVATRRPVRNVVMCIRRPATNDRVWLLVSVEPELAEDGSVRQVVATLVDISERKRLEESLLQSQKLESIGRLAGGVAHDFNNMLTVIVGCFELALRKLPPEAPVRKELSDGLNASARASALTKQLLIFARKQTSSPRLTDVSETLRSVADLISRLIGEHIQFTLDATPELWPVWIDPTQLEQVILNLAVNARDAMSQGGRLSIDATNVDGGEGSSAPAKGSFVRIRVSDTGEGMTAETRSHIFEPFFTTKGVGSGTGLGLATAHGIIEQHGGYITVDSALGAGSTFSVYLVPTRSSVARGKQPSTPEGRWVGHETILVAEDNDTVRSVAVSVLRSAGYEVLEARDGVEALEVARAHFGSIHLLVTDIVMPRMDGRALAVQLRKERLKMRVLFVSGYAEGTAPAELGRVLPKPYRIDDLAREVRSVLDE